MKRTHFQQRVHTEHVHTVYRHHTSTIRSNKMQTKWVDAVFELLAAG